MDDIAGAPAPQPAVLGVAAAAELAGFSPASTISPPGYAVLTKDVEGVGRAGKLVCARAARIAPWIGTGQARAATPAEVELAEPFHIVIED